MKRSAVILVLAMVLAGLLAGNCFAAPAWYNCNMEAAGQITTDSYVCLTVTPVANPVNPQQYKRWCLLTAATARQLLATSLTSSAAGLRVRCLVDFALTTPPINSLYVISDNF